MSEIISTEEGMQLVLNDAEYICDQTILHSEGMSEIICSDGTRAILVNGHFLQNEDTVVLGEEDINQFYVDGDNGQILLTDSQEEELSNITSNGQIIELIDAGDVDGNLHIKEPEIVYIAEDNLLTTENISQYQFAESVEDSNTVATPIIDLEELITQDGEPLVLENLNQDNRYQYAILKDGKLHIQPFVGDFIPVIATDETEKTIGPSFVTLDEQILNVTHSAGKHIHNSKKLNLVDLSNHKQECDPIKQSQKRKSNGENLQNLLNKKLQLGRTPEGKKLVAKIVHVKRGSNENTLKSQSQISNLQFESTSSQQISENLNSTFTFMKLVSKDAFQYITRTLEGLMSMDSVKKKLEHKNIIVNIVEKKWLSSKKVYSTSNSFTSGYMQSSTSVDKDGKLTQRWTFVPDNDTQSYFSNGTRQGKFTDVTNVKLMITYPKGQDRVVQVILDPPSKNTCFKCLQQFRTKLQLKVHMNVAHNIIKRNGGNPETNIQNKKDSQNIDENYSIAIVTQPEVYSLSSQELAPKKQFMKFYQCQICKRSFSRHSNLLRHIGIHGGAEEMFQCPICGCSYHYMSSLTRHLVQNHITKINQDS